MVDVLIYACNAVGPLLIMILAGYLFKRMGLFTDEFLRVGNKLVFYVCLPLYLFYNIYQIDDWKDIPVDVLLFAAVMVVIFFLGGMLLVRCTVRDPKKKGVMLQCVFRSNFAIIGIPLSEALCGSEGVAVAALISVLTIPVYNVLAVISLTMYCQEEGGGRLRLRPVLRKIAHNPLIIGVLSGLCCLLLRQLIPQENGEPVFLLAKQGAVVYKAIGNVSRIASPLALFILGGQFSLGDTLTQKKEIVLGTLLRLVVVPVVALGLTWLLSERFSVLQATPAVYTAYLALYGTPVAVSSAIMAKEMNNDGELAGQLVVWTSLFSLLTIFLFAVWLRGAGLV